MKIKILRSWIAIGLILAKVIVMVWAFILCQSLIYTSNQLISILSVLLPLSGTQITLIYKHYFGKMQTKQERSKTKVSPMHFILGVGILLAYLILLLGVLTSHQPSEDIVDVQKLIGVVETVVGVYVGLIVTNLYKTAETEI